MFRTVAVAVVAVALCFAGAALAGPVAPLDREAGPNPDATGAGGQALTNIPASQMPAASGNEVFVTGKVVMATPAEIVIHTAGGMQRFTLGPETKSAYIPAEGDVVTIGYVPTEGAPTATTVTRAAAPAANPERPEVVATGPSAGTAGPETPAENPPAQASVPAAPPTSSESTQGSTPPSSNETSQAESGSRPGPPHLATLPKTASDRPLILLIGLSALLAAGAIRLASRA